MTPSSPSPGPPSSGDDATAHPMDPSRRTDPEVAPDTADTMDIVHASLDGELSAEEERTIRPDESWRARVEQARSQREAVRSALTVEPVAEATREAHLAAALAAFDERTRAAPIAVVPPSRAQHPAPPPPGAAPGDQLAARRVARDWVRKVPVGIAAAVLAAVVIVGATRMGDDGDENTQTLAEAPAAESSGDELTESETAEPDLGASLDASAPAGDGMSSFELESEPSSLDGFADAVVRVGRGGDDMPEDATRTDSPRLDSSCSKQDVMELVGSADSDELTLLEGSVEGRDVVGVVVGRDFSQVTIIDLDRCEVVSE